MKEEDELEEMSKLTPCERLSLFLQAAEDNEDLQDLLKDENTDKYEVRQILETYYLLTEDDIEKCAGWMNPERSWWWW